ncbi:hypothetical protein FOL47_008469, partial [Perkinsus chesapeaki]
MSDCDSIEDLAASLDDYICQYAAITSTLLRVRKTILGSVRLSRKCPSHVRRRKFYQKYEFHNCYGRFYIAVINGRIPFKKVLDKLRAEVREKHLECGILDSFEGAEDVEEFAEKCGVEPLTKDTVDVDAAVDDIIEQPTKDLANIKFVHKSDPEYLSLEMTKERYEEMISFARTFAIERLDKDEAESASLATKLFKLCIACYITASSPLYWGFGPKVYQFVAENLNARLEGYASPFNHTLVTYCSPFCLDMVFGSLGSVYGPAVTREVRRLVEELRPDERVMLVLNPPYLESELVNCADRVSELVSIDERIRVMSIVPQWDDAPGIQTLRGEDGRLKGFLAEDRLLGKYDHYYWDYQKWRPINAKFGSRLLVYSKSGNVTTDERGKVDELLGIMKKQPDEEVSLMSESPILRVPSDDPGPREDNLGWAEYFMALAHVTAMRSKDPSTQVGAVIVNHENKVVGIGYNGFPSMGEIDNDALLNWGKKGDKPIES